MRCFMAHPDPLGNFIFDELQTNDKAFILQPDLNHLLSTMCIGTTRVSLLPSVFAEIHFVRKHRELSKSI